MSAHTLPTPGRRNLVRSLLIASLLVGLNVPAMPAAAIPVFDASNYAQNVLTAARTLQQINQQIQSLQNEAAMLINMGKNLSRVDFPQLQALRDRLAEIDTLIAEARGLAFEVSRLDDQFGEMFPDAFDTALRLDQRVTGARARLDTSMATFRQTMAVQAAIAENVRKDSEAMAEIIATSQEAEGALQAAQATNQLLALTAKQQLQLQSMLATQFRSTSIEQARRAQAEQDAQAVTRRFLGSGRAYTPQ
ncbi:P-type conjugative transfer protein TrbJ [Sphingomonas laterariae]|uniref:P-type conjugative transfer protein TrbJ n=1 Tax=Edaphosphingomonas laterariae TaxID=861865 RepID=A0A239J0I1_9SPHN|nr:P-type conjugative transfer protein TrbJ [Sphingomonas laterariae]SNS99275.1 P-type conjugative transfer protein TrbJ [Sphingomonas laterariae]